MKNNYRDIALSILCLGFVYFGFEYDSWLCFFAAMWSFMELVD